MITSSHSSISNSTREMFIIPEIVFDSSLLLSPRVFLLAILFGHRVFESEYLNESPPALRAPDLS